MLDALAKILTSISDFFTSIWHWITDGIYDFATWAFAGFIEWWTVHALTWALDAMVFAWGVAKQILQDLNVSAHLATAWSALPPDVLGLLTLVRIPEVVVTLITAFVTKYVLRFIPGVS